MVLESAEADTAERRQDQSIDPVWRINGAIRRDTSRSLVGF